MKFNGKIAGKVMVGLPIPITTKDVESLVAAPPGSRTTGVVARLRASHHNVARLLAHGLDNREVAAMTGYTENRISQLANAPAMQDLIATYRERVEERQAAELDQYVALKTKNMIAAERHIADQIDALDEEGELLPIKTALAVSADGADRLGYGKKSQVNHNHEFASALERAIARSGKVVDVTPSVKQIEPPQSGPPVPRTILPLNSQAEPASRPLIRRRA